MAASVPDTFCKFYLMKNYKIAHNSTTTEAREKNKRDLELLEFENFSIVYLTKFKNNQIYLIK